MKTKRVLAALVVAAGLSFGMAAPAGAMIIQIHGVTDVAVGNPDIRVAVEVELQPCISPISLTGTGFIPCIAPTPVRS